MAAQDRPGEDGPSAADRVALLRDGEVMTREFVGQRLASIRPLAVETR